MRLILLLSVGLAILLASPAVATQLVYDPFRLGVDPNNGNPAAGEYNLGNIAGQNPVDPLNPSFWGGPWVNRGAPTTAVVRQTGLTYLGAPVEGGSVVSNESTRNSRPLASPLTDSTVGNYYIGFLANFGTGDYVEGGLDGNDMGYRAMEFYDVNDNHIIGIAYNTYGTTIGPEQTNPETARMYLDSANTHVILDGSPQGFVNDGLTHLIVIKLSLSASVNQDSISVFLDPSKSEEPVIPSAMLTNRNITLGAIGSFALSGGNGSSGLGMPVLPVFDELRVGTEFVDVLPDFPLKGDCCGSGPVGADPDGPDDEVDIDDYNAIYAHLNLAGQPSYHGDMNGDGKVTIADYRIWKDNRTDLGSISDLASNQNVPEPGTIALLAIGLAAAASGVWRRSREAVVGDYTAH